MGVRPLVDLVGHAEKQTQCCQHGRGVEGCSYLLWCKLDAHRDERRGEHAVPTVRLDGIVPGDPQGVCVVTTEGREEGRTVFSPKRVADPVHGARNEVCKRRSERQAHKKEENRPNAIHGADQASHVERRDSGRADDGQRLYVAPQFHAAPLNHGWENIRRARKPPCPQSRGSQAGRPRMSFWV